jgi:hypothetical protein
MLDRTGDVQPHSIGRSSKIRRQAAPAPTISTRRFDNFKPVVFDQFHAAGDSWRNGTPSIRRELK